VCLKLKTSYPNKKAYLFITTKKCLEKDELKKVKSQKNDNKSNRKVN
jgi:hypothetical protein